MTGRGALAVTILALGCGPGAAQDTAQAALVPYTVVGDAIPNSLTGKPGDPVNGRAIVVKRENTCLLCHSGPFPDQRFQGDLSPNLKGTGSRWSEGELRLRLVRLTDSWATRRMFVAVRQYEALPAPARQLVDHLAKT